MGTERALRVICQSMGVRKITSVAVFMAVTTLVACASVEPASESDAAGSTSVLVAGDSLSVGMYASTESGSFVTRVLDHLAPATLTTASRPHETLAVVSNYTEIPAGVDVAIIELGTNDVGVPTPEDDFRDGYAALLTAVRDTSPDAKLVCVGTWTGWGWTQDETIRSSCIEAGGAYVHLRDLFNRNELRGPEGRETHLGTSDWFHPNDDGHMAIARRITEALDDM